MVMVVVLTGRCSY